MSTREDTYLSAVFKVDGEPSYESDSKRAIFFKTSDILAIQ